MTSEWRKHLVNYNATPEERRMKYGLCRGLGDTCPQATRRRNWRWNKIARVHGYTDFTSMKNCLEG